MRAPRWPAIAPVLLLCVVASCGRRNTPPPVASTPPDEPVSESTVIRVAGETVLEQELSTVEVESAAGGATRVTLTNPKGGKTEVTASAESDFSAKTAGIPLPPGAKSGKALRIQEGKSDNPVLSAFSLAGARGAVYTVPGMSVDQAVAFYTKHKSGRFQEVEDSRSMGVNIVIVWVSDDEDLAIGLLPSQDNPADTIVHVLDLSQMAQTDQ
jgi:hypothetical protein